MALVAVIADAQVLPALNARLRSLCEEDAPVRAVCAPPQPARLDLDLQIDPDHDPDPVLAAVQLSLFGPVTLPGTGGLLRPERLGPDGTLFASVVLRAVMDVPGVAGVHALLLDRSPFPDPGLRPAAGHWFDFDTGGVWVNGRRAP
jgi:hypothetical protein